MQKLLFSLAIVIGVSASLNAQYTYNSLRIVIGNDTNPASLVMNTNQDTTVRVQGQRSNDSTWVEVLATWQNSPNLKFDPYAPTGNSWRFSPSDTGTGWIRVTQNNNVTIPDSLPVIFTPGPPVRASIEIITPAAEIIAGKPIPAVVRVYDKDGNSYTYKFDTTAGGRAAYHDTLGIGAITFPEPFIVVEGKTIMLYGSPWGCGNQTFINGRDTVSFTLFNAPLDTTQRHQISANLIIGADTIRAATTPFVLHLDNVSQVKIEYPNGTPAPDTVYLTNPITIVSRAFDIYGNKIGDIACNWTVTDSLHPITGPTNVASIYYDSRLAVKNERGHIIVDHNGIRDSIYVIIIGPPIRLVRAITRDTSGNGVLDRVELNFSRKFELPANALFAGLTIVANQRDTLTIGRIVNTGSGKNDSVWIVELVESHTGMPQTVWTPQINLPLQSAYDIAAVAITAIDGAGPVVWRVIRYPVAANNHQFDSVVVTFSEPVQRWDGGSLNVLEKPGDIFYVWKKDANDITKFILVDSMFAGINNLKRDPGKSNLLTFTMSNGKDLNGTCFLSIADSARNYVTDTTVYAIPPNLNNNPNHVIGSPSQNVLPKQFEFISFACKGSSRSLRYTLPRQCYVSLKYYDIRGRTIGSFVNHVQKPGYYTISLPFSAWARGTYIQMFTAGNFIKKDLIVEVR